MDALTSVQERKDYEEEVIKEMNSITPKAMLELNGEDFLSFMLGCVATATRATIRERRLA